MTWADAIADVTTQLEQFASDTVTVYGHEPGRPGWRRPRAICVSMGPLTPDEYGVTIRIYQDTNKAVDEAQTALTSLVMDVEDALSSVMGRTTWQTVWLPDESAWSCSTTVGVPREDF